MFHVKQFETFAKRPLSKSALIWQIPAYAAATAGRSALDSIFGTLVTRSEALALTFSAILNPPQADRPP